MARPFKVTRLKWTDIALEKLKLPARTMKLTLGLGSGLAVRAGDTSGTLWAIGDRGPNLKLKDAIADYGLDVLKPHMGEKGAKLIPRPGIGPAIVELRLAGDSIEHVRTLALTGRRGRPISGLPIPGGEGREVEPAYDLNGNACPDDPSGADTEALVALSNGSFVVVEEYGPSIMKVNAKGCITMRWVPEGTEGALDGADYPVAGVLPASAAARRLNRGFEALALSPDEKALYVMFQSAPEGSTGAPVVPVLKLSARTGKLLATYAYPFDKPKSFRRDAAAGKVDEDDLKVSEVVALDGETLLVLERITETAKLYAVRLPRAMAGEVPVLEKRLVFSTDDVPRIGPDVEGVALLTPTTLILVTDNDFGVAGAKTEFWKIEFATALSA
ncbi:hypothetical protein sos41_35480 [Alphaproteobacteria bacterium SO-S41]|nr:hypothetical protein sos41_35480 [Alphaproteobacteria bacterium SO-S41]